MNKLKTLKDLSYLRRGIHREDTDSTGFYDVFQIGEYQNICYPIQLKQELGIKWIKHFQEVLDEEEKPDKDHFDELLCYDCMSKIELLKQIFNISEDDLK